jgi:hypothetical protein
MVKLGLKLCIAGLLLVGACTSTKPESDSKKTQPPKDASTLKTQETKEEASKEKKEAPPMPSQNVSGLDHHRKKAREQLRPDNLEVEIERLEKEVVRLELALEKEEKKASLDKK